MKKISKLSAVATFALAGILMSSHAFGQTTTYTYDALGRVIEVDKSTSENRTYTYDEAGNRIAMTVVGGGGSGNSAPICSNWTYTHTTGAAQVTIDPIAGHCTDGDNDPLTLSNIGQPSAGYAYISGNSIVWAFLAAGTRTISFTADDGNSGSDTAILTLVITGGCSGIGCN